MCNFPIHFAQVNLWFGGSLITKLRISFRSNERLIWQFSFTNEVKTNSAVNSKRSLCFIEQPEY